jgi:hypothetical protein
MLPLTNVELRAMLNFFGSKMAMRSYARMSSWESAGASCDAMLTAL